MSFIEYQSVGLIEIRQAVEGNLVKALNHCMLENMKRLIEPYSFWELSNIEDNLFQISLSWLLGLW